MDTKPNRLIPTTWFRAQSMSTSISFIVEGAFTKRFSPVSEQERELGWFVLPPFQRPPVWTREQKIRLIESLWLGLPVGVFIFNQSEDVYSPYDNWLLDGQQRVTAVLEYMADAFPVLGYLYSELTEIDHRKWMLTGFPSMKTQIDKEDELREVYDRLAYGGTAHGPKE